MNLNHKPNADEIFLSALELSPDHRTEFLDQQCSTLDSAIRREVEQLLDGYNAADVANLGQSPLNLADYVGSALSETADEPTEPRDFIDDTIGVYRLRRTLGEGGMGTVYLADQVHPVQRQVALKIIKPGMDSRQVIRSFRGRATGFGSHWIIPTLPEFSTRRPRRPAILIS